MTVTDYGEIVAALRAVPGVADADVEPDRDGGGMGLLRLGLAPGFDEVQVATTVGRLLRERFGLGVDAERVQLVEDAAMVAAPTASATASTTASALRALDLRTRPSIQRMHLVSEGLDITASVTLKLDGRVRVGEARGTATPNGVQRAVALATLQAVEQLTDGKVRFELDHLDIAPTGSERTVVVGLTMVAPTGSEKLTGAAVVREDVRQAVIRSTLDALNRRLGTLIEG
ncbi:MAG TPA: hypothetical protein VNB94_00345 [Mycobacteriales bacterium]|nr:hypothetical protein [Mycobacteriales bacterium]